MFFFTTLTIYANIAPLFGMYKLIFPRISLDILKNAVVNVIRVALLYLQNIETGAIKIIQ